MRKRKLINDHKLFFCQTIQLTRAVKHLLESQGDDIAPLGLDMSNLAGELLEGFSTYCTWFSTDFSKCKSIA